jgi:hypothetical protein
MRFSSGLLAIIIGALAAFALPARAQDVLEPAGLDLASAATGIVAAYVASAVSVASMVGVFKWALPLADLVPFLRWLPPLFLKGPGEKKLRPAQRNAIRTLVFALSGIGAWRGAVAPIGGEDAGVFGLVGATCLVALLAMGARELLQRAVKPRKAGA